MDFLQPTEAESSNKKKSWWKRLAREQWLSHLNKLKLSESMLESLPQVCVIRNTTKIDSFSCSDIGTFWNGVFHFSLCRTVPLRLVMSFLGFCLHVSSGTRTLVHFGVCEGFWGPSSFFVFAIVTANIATISAMLNAL